MYMIWVAYRSRILDTGPVGWRGVAVAQADTLDEIWAHLPDARLTAKRMAAETRTVARVRCELLGPSKVPLYDEYFEPGVGRKVT